MICFKKIAAAAIVMMLIFVSGCSKAGETQDDEKTLSCTIQVSCKQILENMDKLDSEKKELVPEDGIIFEKQTINFKDGETAFDILKNEMRKNGIHLDYSENKAINMTYVKGIANLCEFDVNAMSGWTYNVNDEPADVACSQYILKEGDFVEWVYFCGE